MNGILITWPRELTCMLSPLSGFLFGTGCYEILGTKDGAKLKRKEGDWCSREIASNPADTADSDQ